MDGDESVPGPTNASELLALCTVKRTSTSEGIFISSNFAIISPKHSSKFLYGIYRNVRRIIDIKGTYRIFHFIVTEYELHSENLPIDLNERPAKPEIPKVVA